MALEIFLRKSGQFSALTGVQPAFAVAAVERYAQLLAGSKSATNEPRIQLVTSTLDPFRDATERLAKRLRERGVNVTSLCPAGPHDQRFLREVGTLEMLLFQARAVQASVEP